LAASDRFCRQCGTPAEESLVPSTASVHAAGPETAARPDEASIRIAPGDLIGERFRIVTMLGKGGMGEVFRADDLSLRQSVALKFLPQGLAHDPNSLQRLRGEVKAARQVSHPNVCRVYDLGQADGQLFLAMEFVNGQDLALLLKELGRLSEEHGVEIARQLCLGLGAIHDRGIMHRDLKPSNVMLDGRGQIRITDFGLAAPVAANPATDDAAAGTPAYQSPEQLAGRGVTPRSDLFALGLILYQVFTGERPFSGSRRTELAQSRAALPPSRLVNRMAGLNPAIERIILKCLEEDPRDRPQTAYEVLAALPDAKVEGGLHPHMELALETLQRHRLEVERGDKVWSAYSHSYDRVLLGFPPYRRLIADLIAVIPPGRQSVLDLGAGTGNVTASLLAAGHKVTAVESNAAMLDQLRSLSKKLTGLELTVVESSAEDLGGLADGAFDAVLMFNMLYAVDDPLRSLKDAHRLLKPRGVLAFSTTHSETSLDSLLTSLREWLDETRQFEARSADYQLVFDLNKQIEKEVARRNTREQYRQWTVAAGFEIIRDVPTTYEDAVMLIHAIKP
jgi:ubiquinone/menaquinone biosynthesis C-methylase UbiE